MNKENFKFPNTPPYYDLINSLIEDIYENKISEPTIYKILIEESNNDITYLKLVKNTVEEKILEYNEDLATKKTNNAQAKYQEQKSTGENITVPTKLELSIEGFIELKKRHPQWATYTYEQKHKLNNEFSKSKEAKENGWATLTLDYDIICNNHWELVPLKNLIYIIDEIIYKIKDGDKTQIIDNKPHQTPYDIKTSISIQTLTLEYILQELGISNDIPKTKIASFMQFLTGRQLGTKPEDSSFYKIIGRYPSTKDEEKNYNERCEIIAKEFDKIGLEYLSNKIRKGKEY